MKRYVLKINDSTYVSSLRWVAMVIPEIQTNSLDNALLFTEEYLKSNVPSYGNGETKKDLISKYFPHIQFIKVKIVVDEDENHI